MSEELYWWQKGEALDIKIGSTVIYHDAETGRRADGRWKRGFGVEADIGVVTDIITGPPSPGSWLSEAEIFFQKERKKVKIPMETLINSDRFTVVG